MRRRTRLSPGDQACRSGRDADTGSVSSRLRRGREGSSSSRWASSSSSGRTKGSVHQNGALDLIRRTRSPRHAARLCDGRSPRAYPCLSVCLNRPVCEQASTIIHHPVSSTTDLLAFALSLADAADAVSMRYYRTDHAAERKADGSFVTPGDLEIEALLRERIAEAYPEHAVLGEEEGDAGGRRTPGRAGSSTRSTGRITSCAASPSGPRSSPSSAAGASRSAWCRLPRSGRAGGPGRGLGAYRGETGGRTGAGERIRVLRGGDTQRFSDLRRRPRRDARPLAGRLGRSSAMRGGCARRATSGASASSPKAPPT